uniref:Roadblock/LAMTOR2 domain-containing protein n=1 Tax=Rhodosorus marinus TaxID=101924 RepID=A0A7S0G2B1_9RHOD
MEEGASGAEVASYAPLKLLVQRTPGLLGAIVSDLEGVSVTCAVGSTCGEAELALLKTTEAASIAAELAEKLQMGRCKSVVTYLSTNVVVYFISPLLLVKLVAESHANVGLLLETVDDINKITSDLVKILLESQESAQSKGLDI